MSEPDVTSHPLVDSYYEAMNANDDDAIGALYAEDALIIRFAGSVRGRVAIVDFLRGVRAEHQPFDLHQVDRIRAKDDIVMWDAMVTTDEGVLQTTDVMVVNEDGLVDHHVLGTRGYWGR